MENSLILDGVKYISSKQAAGITGYAKDYIGQMCRAGRIDAKLVGRNWFVSERSLLNYRERGKGRYSSSSKRDSIERGEELLSNVSISYKRDIPLYRVEVDERPLNPEPSREVPIIKRERELELEPQLSMSNVKDRTVVPGRTVHRLETVVPSSARSDLAYLRERRMEAQGKVRGGGIGKLAFVIVLIILTISSVLLESQLRYVAGSDSVERALIITNQEKLTATAFSILKLFGFPQ
jgi:hypothetical protein